MDALNVKRAHIYPKATEEIPTITEVISELVQKGHAYEAKGNVYFRVRSKADYGKLSRRSLDGMMAGARIEVEEAKEHPLDFALWKAAKPGEPNWPSPWGPGRPGWHIECSAMSLKHLGQTLDIHGGGQDLIFPHHENEIAQSESLTGVPFVRYWLHNGLLQLGQDKMSKSLGNLITLRDALSRYSPDAIRLFVLSSHYRSPTTYSDEGLEAMERAAERLRRSALRVKVVIATPYDAQPYRQRFVEAMDDDFNTAQALAALFDLAEGIDRNLEHGFDVTKAQDILRDLAAVLGLTLRERGEKGSKFYKDVGEGELPSHGEVLTQKRELAEAMPAIELIELLVSLRDKLRAEKQWALADTIRSRLTELGIVLEDTPQGTVWRHKR
jgi:cysteinyl-tRNA synthetase